MFEQRADLDNGREYTRDFFEKLVANLRTAGFDAIGVVLPHSHVPTKESQVSPEGFLESGIVYPSVILRARSTDRDLHVKVLFVTKRENTAFVDDTFPRHEKEDAPKLYVGGPDPGVVYSYFGFLREYLGRPRAVVAPVLGFATFFSFIFLFAEVRWLVEDGRFVLTRAYRWYVHWDIVYSVVALILVARFFLRRRGLWIRDDEQRFFFFVRRALRGDLRNNPLFSLLLAVIGSLLTALALKLLKLGQ